MNHVADAHASAREPEMEPGDPPVSIAHVLNVLRAYRHAIVLCIGVVAIAAAIGLITIYLLSPSQHITALPFRLEFQGATDGHYPNGLKFSPTDIVTPPILLKVYEANELSRYNTYNGFAQSIFLLEANRAYEALAAEYQARLSDPRLTAIDRERIQKEFEMKSDTINKNEYSINYIRPRGIGVIPESLVRKVLLDILNGWAAYEVQDQHVLDFRVTVLSPRIVDDPAIDSSDTIAAIQVLRSKIYRVLDNIQDIKKLPGAELAKTSRDPMSLEEIRIRLEEIVRFDLEPLVGEIRDARLIRNPSMTLQFLQNQLAYDQRQLQSARDRAETARVALAAYTNDQRTFAVPGSSVSPEVRGATGPGETVMPQLSDTFIDRLLSLTTLSVDRQYREKLLDDYTTAARAAIPMEQSVAYDQQLLDEIRRPPAGNTAIDPPSINRQLSASRQQVREMIANVNELYHIISHNMNPSTQLFAMTAPATIHVERGMSAGRTLLFYILIVLLSIPVILFACLVHHRVREEEVTELGRGTVAERSEVAV
ncbi:MAG TPA: hypothetical protein VLV86_25345 [Vicinamibacterales bacterium]|nr:hypothetical protein [Thermoanaerobaculia bacterium]HUK37276.1 hypothetical protein [Vicinamibacterales bacterium]